MASVLSPRTGRLRGEQVRRPKRYLQQQALRDGKPGDPLRRPDLNLLLSKMRFYRRFPLEFLCFFGTLHKVLSINVLRSLVIV